MKFEAFKQLFLQSLELAADNAEQELGKRISRSYEIIFYGAGRSGDILDVDNAATLLFIGEDHFYRVIDLAVQQVLPEISRVFVRISGHKPVPVEQTWDSPSSKGPFKQIMAQIQEIDI